MRKNGRLPVTSLKAHAAEIQEFNALKEKEKTLMAEIEALKKAAKEAGQEAPECKRKAKEQLKAHVVTTEGNEPQVLGPIPYEFVA